MFPDSFFLEVFSDIYHFAFEENTAQKSDIIPPRFWHIIFNLVHISVEDRQKFM